MASTFTVTRAQIIYGLCLPLAVLLGVLLADPTQSGSIAVVTLLLVVLCVPLLLRYHHPLLVFSWHASIAPALLPGRPDLWMILAWVSLAVGVVTRATDPTRRFLPAPEVTRSLVFLLLVIGVTALFRGGLGIRSLGSEQYGGRANVYLVCAVAGFFALVSQPIPRARAAFYTALFFLPGLTAVVGNLAYMAGPKAYFLFNVFPPIWAIGQASVAENVELGPGFARIGGFYFASLAVVCFLVARYGVRGTLDLRQPWRLLLLVGALVGCLYSGFRSALVLSLLTLGIAFVLEGLHRTRLMVALAAAALIGWGLLARVADRLPYAMQRTISFLPVRLDPRVEQDAHESTRWRVEIWQEALPEVPRYLLLGKGFKVDPGELYLTLAAESSPNAYLRNYHKGPLVTGDYHNGPLSLLLPLGLPGAVAFVWFLLAGGRVLYRNYRYGEPELQFINRLLLALFLARILFFLVVFGGFWSDFFFFTGIVGFGLSLNGGARPPPQAAGPTQWAQDTARNGHDGCSKIMT